jgi:hypothetical protein
MNWFHWFKELGISPSKNFHNGEIRTTIERANPTATSGSRVKNAIRVLYERELMCAVQSDDFRLEENESLSGWIWNPREEHPEEELDALFDEWALRIQEKGYVEQLNEQHTMIDVADQRVRYRRYLKPSLRPSIWEGGERRPNFGNIMLEIQKEQGITRQFRVQLSRYPGRNMEETASLAKFMELILDEKLPDETKESDNRK